ncbi:response regulator [Leptolyngbya sp. NIES-2104]|uniref:response regulator n=1 Tax=Leptolyngbya sp. NIES-2104 TaxID=1552121 RepID=UPI0006ECC50D|nr:response regulator [Leptolyngbya sp. NIES-2104]GAP94573.1 two component transcriptional regulator, winged helix family protein [Leptolyngbya sp. NIES-2104]
MKILLIEDDSAIVELLSETLTAHHYTIDVATDGQTGLTLATDWEYDLVLLDLLIPRIDGIALCQQLRSQQFQKPILLLTAKDSSADIVKGLDAGADDYLTKPFELSELLARIRALLRRGETKLAPTVLTWGALQVNLESAQVLYAEQPLALSPKEYSLLTLFLRNPQRTFSRSEIIDRLWSIDACPGEGTVTNLIKDLRRKLKTAGMQTDLLETVYGMGYRLRSPESSAIQTVLARYQKTFASRVDRLEQDIQFNPSKAAQEAHKLAGALGSFGYEIGSKIARSIEHLLIEERSRSQITPLIAQLKQELTKPPTQINVTQPPQTQAAKVMLVDDDAVTLNLLSDLLCSCGLQVTSVQHPEKFWQTLSMTQPDVLVMDLEMPNLNGAELCRDVRQHDRWRHLPILMVTAHTDARSIQQAFAAGADDFIRKSLIQPEFVPRVMSRIDRSRLQAIQS